jgi:hypothetical protein
MALDLVRLSGSLGAEVRGVYPPTAGMLYALEVPVAGGDTLFANTTTATRSGPFTG